MVPLAIWNFVKKHASTILLAVALVVGYGFYRHSQTSWADTVAKLDTSHQVALDQVAKDRQLEEEEHATEVKTLHETLDKVQKAYDAATTAVVHNETVEEHAIVKKYAADNGGLAQLVAEKFGLVVVK